jgi:hypothetical protein
MTFTSTKNGAVGMELPHHGALPTCSSAGA